MKALLGLLLAAAAAGGLVGCMVVPTTEFNACQAENRNLSDQNRAQLEPKSKTSRPIAARWKTASSKAKSNSPGCRSGPASTSSSWRLSSANATGCTSSSRAWPSDAAGSRPN